MIWHGKFRSLTSFPFKCCTYVISLYLHNLRINLWILEIHEVADIFDIVYLTLAWSSLWTCLVEDPPLYFILPYQKLWTLPRVVLQELFMLGKNILKSYLPLVGWLRNSPAPLSRVLNECLSHVEMRSYLKLWVFLTSLAFFTYVFCFNVHITKYKPDSLWANWSLIK